VSVLFVTDERCRLHVAGAHHPERPERLSAVVDGIDHAGLREVLVPHVPEPASIEALERVHDPAYVAAVRSFCLTGGGNLDADTGVVPASYEAALLAAGSGLDAIAALREGRVESALCAVRPPGHHARPAAAMGFCLFNNVAVAAAALAAVGERVLIVDVDVHHGNGTEEIFYAEPDVAYASLHEWPLYPGTGDVTDVGHGPGTGTTLNVPVPAGATGDVYLAAIDALIVPYAEVFAPTWLLISLGFDAHRADPLAGVSLSAGDFGAIVTVLRGLVPPGRCLAMLEGGYDLAAVAASSAASVAALAGLDTYPEAQTSGGPGRQVVDLLVEARKRA
jgi:acetoin utilization deacetylase AcuC-like enzyme